LKSSSSVFVASQSHPYYHPKNVLQHVSHHFS
jgi:hypothetical protein